MPIPNAEQIEYWNEQAGPRWAARQAAIDALLDDITRAALDTAEPQPEDWVLDVGCGCGTTTIELARRVGADGRVLGIDISKPMLAVAEERVRDALLSNVTLELADATTFAFEEERFDLAFSRFGVMFFDDPGRAFANIRRALRRGGRLAFLAWRALEDNPWFSVPIDAAALHLPPQERPGPNAPGPLAFADADRVRSILEEAGFNEIEFERRDSHIKLAAPNETERAVDLMTQIGPIASAFAGADPKAQAAAKAALLAAFKSHDGPSGVLLRSSIWYVSALKETP